MPQSDSASRGCNRSYCSSSFAARPAADQTWPQLPFLSRYPAEATDLHWSAVGQPLKRAVCRALSCPFRLPSYAASLVCASLPIAGRRSQGLTSPAVILSALSPSCSRLVPPVGVSHPFPAQQLGFVLQKAVGAPA